MRVCMLAHVMRASFAFRTRQATVIQDIKHKTVSREQLRVQIENPNKEIIERIKQEEGQQVELEQSILNISSNDSNPKNFIKVLIRKDVQIQKNERVPIIVPVEPRPQKVLITGIRRKIPQSPKKVIPLVKQILGKHIQEAFATMDLYEKKGARFIKSALVMVMNHAIQRGMDVDRLYVNAACTGKFKRWTKMRYHAKSRMSRATRDSSQVRITLEERDTKQMFKEILVGKTPQVLASQVRQALLQSDSSFQQIRSLQHVVLAKGRQQQRLMLKREVLKRYHETKNSEGRQLSLEYIKKEILDRRAGELADEYESRKSSRRRSSLQARQTLFRRNEETNV